MPHDVILNFAVTFWQMMLFNLIPFIAIYWIKRVVID